MLLIKPMGAQGSQPPRQGQSCSGKSGSAPTWLSPASPEETGPSSRPVGLNQGRFCPQGHCTMSGGSVVVTMGDGVWHQVGGRPGRLPHRGRPHPDVSSTGVGGAGTLCYNYLGKALSSIPARAGHLGLEPGLHAGGLQIALCLETQMPVTLGFPTLPHPHPERPPRRRWPTWRSEGRGLRNSFVLQLWDQREDLQGQVRDENPSPLLRRSQEIPDGESRALKQGWALGRHRPRPEAQAPPPSPASSPAGAPPTGEAERLSLAPSCVYFTRPSVLGRANQEGAGKDGPGSCSRGGL